MRVLRQRTLFLFAAVAVAAVACAWMRWHEPPLPVRVANAGLETLERRALHTARVDWNAWRRVLAERITERSSIADAHAIVREMVAALKDPHTRFVVSAPEPPAASAPQMADEHAAPALSTPASKAPDSPAPVQPSAPRPTVPLLPQAEALAGGIAYLLLPPCTDGSAAHTRAYAAALAEGICRVRAAATAGWIVDLRLNGGGTMWPMVHGLERLLGDGVYGASVSASGGRSEYGVTDGVAWLDRGAGRHPQFEAPQPEGCPRVTPGRLALLIGPWTMSSGEIVAAACVRAPMVRRFGGPTAGMATATEPFPLPDGSTLVIATEEIRDAANRPLPFRIEPDEAVEWGDWPSASDAAVRAAARWIRAPGEAHPQDRAGP